MFSPAIRRMLANGSAKIGPPVRVEITELRNSGISAGTQAANIELPPSTNHLFMNGKGKQGGRFKAPEYREWIATAVPLLAGSLRPVKLLPFRIRYTLFGSLFGGGVGLNPNRDLGNLEKPITDALVSACVIPGDSLAAGLYGITLEFSNQDEGRAFIRVEIREGPWTDNATCSGGESTGPSGRAESAACSHVER